MKSILSRLLHLLGGGGRMVKISLNKLDPDGNSLVIHNIRKAFLCGFQLQVTNSQGEVFYKRIPGLLAGEQFIVPLDKAINRDLHPFRGQVKYATVITRLGTENFQLYGNSFYRR